MFADYIQVSIYHDIGLTEASLKSVAPEWSFVVAMINEEVVFRCRTQGFIIQRHSDAWYVMKANLHDTDMARLANR